MSEILENIQNKLQIIINKKFSNDSFIKRKIDKYHDRWNFCCPYCSDNKVLTGYNDLQTVNPALAKEWNYEKNNGLTPAEISPNSGKKVWWKCDKGHEWQATINSRNSGCKCPYCSGKLVIKGENDLQTVNPTLAKEWNYEKIWD